jgi:hypothetical protein
MKGEAGKAKTGKTKAGKAKVPNAQRKPATEAEREELLVLVDLSDVENVRELEEIERAIDPRDFEEEIREEELKELEEYQRRWRQGTALADTAFWLDKSDPTWPWYLALVPGARGNRQAGRQVSAAEAAAIGRTSSHHRSPSRRSDGALPAQAPAR